MLRLAIADDLRRGRGAPPGGVIDLATASPKRLRHAGDWPTPEPRRAPLGTELRALQDAMPRCADGAAPVLSGDGASGAMLIGQAPGWREIETGLPFAWDAGKRLCRLARGRRASRHRLPRALVRDQHRQVLPRTRSGLLGRSAAVACGDRALGAAPASRSCAWSARRLILLVGGIAHRFAFGQGRSSTSLSARADLGGAPGASVLCLPHPSGASTWLNDPARVELWRRGIGLLRDRWQALGRDTRGPPGDRGAGGGARRLRVRVARASGRSAAPARRSTRSRVEALAGGEPAAWGDEELHVTGWYAELDGDCAGDDGGADATVAWLQRDCPLRVLLPRSPPTDVTQDELLRDGLRLAAPQGSAFPSRAEPTGPNLRGQQLVFVGHFADARPRALRAGSRRALPEHLRRHRLRRAGALAPGHHVEQAGLPSTLHEPGEGRQPDRDGHRGRDARKSITVPSERSPIVPGEPWPSRPRRDASSHQVVGVA